MSATQVQVNREGSIQLPDDLRQRFGLREGSVVIAEERAEGILLRPADLVEMYTPERKAEFLLGNATTPEEYAQAVAEVRRMGLDPDQHNGSVEWLLVAVLLAVALVMGLVARRHWRLLTAGGTS